MLAAGDIPGNLSRTAFGGIVVPASRESCRRWWRREAWVLFPDLSNPSMTMNAPRFVFDMSVIVMAPESRQTRLTRLIRLCK